MNEKLTIEHLVPYLPYGLKFMDTDSGHICDLVQMGTIEYTLHHPINGIYRITLNNKYSKPILHPLSDLKLFKKELKAIKFRTDEDGLYSMISDIKEGLGQWDLMKLCFQNHIDCFGLIPKNLAIDINTLTK